MTDTNPVGRFAQQIRRFNTGHFRQVVNRLVTTVTKPFSLIAGHFVPRFVAWFFDRDRVENLQRIWFFVHVITSGIWQVRAAKQTRCSCACSNDGRTNLLVPRWIQNFVVLCWQRKKLGTNCFRIRCPETMNRQRISCTTIIPGLRQKWVRIVGWLAMNRCHRLAQPDRLVDHGCRTNQVHRGLRIQPTKVTEV